MGIIHSSLLKITKSKKMSNIILNQLFTLNEFSRYDNLWIELELYSVLFRIMVVLDFMHSLKHFKCQFKEPENSEKVMSYHLQI